MKTEGSCQCLLGNGPSPPTIRPLLATIRMRTRIAKIVEAVNARVRVDVALETWPPRRRVKRGLKKYLAVTKFRGNTVLLPSNLLYKI